ncbi:unnamed protein product, partial [marine sediment metagenome]
PKPVKDYQILNGLRYATGDIKKISDNLAFFSHTRRFSDSYVIYCD